MRQARRRLGEMKPQELSNLTWAVAAASLPADAGFMKALTAAIFADRLTGFKFMEIGTLMWCARPRQHTVVRCLSACRGGRAHMVQDLCREERTVM
jgi:hypothetical protein